MQPATCPIESSDLRRYRLFESTDVDDTQMRIASVLQPHRLKPGPSRPGRTAYMNCARIERISFGSIGYAGSMTVDAGEIADYYLVILGLRGYGDVSVGSQRMIVGQSQGIVISPRTPFAGTFSDDCEQYFLRVSGDAVRAHSGYEHLRIEAAMDMSRRELAPLLMQLRALAASPETVELAQQNRRVAAELERLIVTLLLAGQPHHSQSRANECASVPKSVRRAEAFIAEHALEPLHVSDIAAAAGVPVRTLLHNFKSFRDTTPMQRVREVRMDQSRELLMQAGENDRVADIALSCGFVNLGRYAKVYREKFGEAPSETLRKASPQRG